MNCQLSPDSLLGGNALYRLLYEGAGTALPCWLSYLVAGGIIMAILANGVLVGSAAITWAERRLLGRFQNRLGPNRWGPFGLLQPIADIAKLITKEDLTPAGADRVLFTVAPVLMLLSLILMTAVIPFAAHTALVNLNVGVLYFLAVGSMTTVAIFMAGWASDNRYAMFGAARAVAMLISYEVPVVLSLLGVVMIAGSMSLFDVVTAQRVPFLLVQPLAFLVFLAGMSAELNRSPFDVSEAESEIIAGYHTEYSGIKFALIQAAEFGGAVVVSTLIATLFFAGWSGPLAGYLGWLWFLLKTGVAVFLFIWIRATYPRLRIDQIMAFSWKFLLPLSLINLVAVTLEVFFLKDANNVLSVADLWTMAGINTLVAVAAIGIFGQLIKDKVTVTQVRSTVGVVPGVSTVEVR